MDNNEILDLIDDNGLNYRKQNLIVDVISNKLNLIRGQVLRAIEELMKEGLLVESSKNKLATANKMKLVKGTISGHSKGFAFLIPTEGNVPHIFIPPKSLNTAMNNDIVLVHRVEGSRGDSTEGEVFKIIKRGNLRVVGTFELLDGYGFLVPDNKRFNKDVFIPKNKIMNAKTDQKVVVKINKFDGRRPEGEIVEILGDKNSPAVEILSIIRGHNLIEEFSRELLNSVKNMSLEIKESDLENRLDLRKKAIFTIDGDDAKDLDDAIDIKYDEKKDVYTLGVHIADVGHYVKRDSLLDREAFNRGTSVYFPHAVLPMLPRELSNGICSLHPKVDRLTTTIYMDIDNKGEVIKHTLHESVINSIERMTYTNVTKILEGDEEMNKRYENIASDLRIMAKLSVILENKRKRRGSLDFDLPETKIIVNPSSFEVETMELRERKVSNKLIESFMLVANETVAKHMHDLKLPFVYRIHEKPSQERLKAFEEFITPFGLSIKEDKGEVSPKDLQKFLSRIEDLEYKDVINKVLLRSMQKAKYRPECLGHYGLAAEYYSHFTSPIRRYPDLTIHRIIKDHLNNKLTAPKIKRLKKFVDEASMQSSITEVAAEKCEREIDDYFKAKFMEDKIGMEFDGTISGVTAYGIFVELDNTIEGFVRVQDLVGDSYKFIESRFMLTNTHTTYSMGDQIKVKVISANALDKRVDFVIIL
jgi:ribonuclease R